MSSAERQALRHVQVGDIIFGIAAGGQEKLLLVHEADDDGFSARHILSQTRVRFGRDGESRWAEGGGSCTIVSTAKLPPDMYAIALGLDRKWASRPEYPDSILTKDEVQLILNNGKFFKANLLPGAEPIVKWAEKINGVRTILNLEWDLISARDNPPSWNEYLDDLPVLVDLLEIPASTSEVLGFLVDMADRASRTQQVGERGAAAAASLVLLRDSWT
jgi:hypothetical protein